MGEVIAIVVFLAAMAVLTFANIGGARREEEPESEDKDKAA